MRKEINRLLSKGMSNIYLKGTIEKNMEKLTLSKLQFSIFKKSVTRSGLGSSNSRSCHIILKDFITIKKSEVWRQNCLWLLYHFDFETNYDVFKSKSPCILLNKNIKRKWKISHTVLERRILCFTS